MIYNKILAKQFVIIKAIAIIKKNIAMTLLITYNNIK